MATSGKSILAGDGTGSISKGSLLKAILGKPSENGVDEDSDADHTTLRSIQSIPVPQDSHCDGDLIEFELKTDIYPIETWWSLIDKGANALIYSVPAGHYTSPQTLHKKSWCVSSDSCYEFTIYDTYGDGIWNPGYYKISYGGDVINEGSAFGSEEKSLINSDACSTSTPCKGVFDRKYFFFFDTVGQHCYRVFLSSTTTSTVHQSWGDPESWCNPQSFFANANLGFSSMVDIGENFFVGGDFCWNGVQRSTKVSIVEANVETAELISFSEPSTCSYEAVLAIPTSCFEEPTETPSVFASSFPTLSPSSPPSVECLDSPKDWHDSDGVQFDCLWYADKQNCYHYGDLYANAGKTANEACCVCGGGTSNNPPTPPPSPPSTTCMPDENLIHLEIKTDGYSGETSWELKNAFNNETISSVSPGHYGSPYHIYNETWCVKNESCHEFIIYDTYGDGLFSPGYYSISYAGDEVKIGGGDFSYFQYYEKSGAFGGGCNMTNSTNSTTSFFSTRHLFRTMLEYFYPQSDDEKLDWQK